MHRDLVELLPTWDLNNSSLSKRAKYSSRVSIRRNRRPKTIHIKDFSIYVDGGLAFFASETLVGFQKPVGWLLMKITPTRYASVWLFQVNPCGIKLENIAFAVSTWYHDSYKTQGERHQVAYFSNTLEVRKHAMWYTLYAKHPLVRSCRGALTVSRSKKTNIDWAGDCVTELLTKLYKRTLVSPGNKIHFDPIL